MSCCSKVQLPPLLLFSLPFPLRQKKKIETEPASLRGCATLSTHSDLAGDVSRAAAADPEEPPPEDDATWTREFFHEENIMHTLQCLLRSGGRTIEDLCRMCIDASASDVVPALTPEGLMPFSNNYGYVFR